MSGNFRSRPVGWRYESHRHSLAARGMKTKKYYVPFVERTGVPVIDYPEEFNSIREKSIVKMSPDEFLRLTKKTGEYAERSHSKKGKHIVEMSQEEYEKSIAEEHKLQRIREGLKKGDEIPIGYIEYDPESNQPTDHEGRHRALVARELGMKEIPVVLVRGRKLTRSKEDGLMGGRWEYGEDEIVPDERFPQYKVVRKKVLPFTYRAYRGKDDAKIGLEDEGVSADAARKIESVFSENPRWKRIRDKSVKDIYIVPVDASSFGKRVKDDQPILQIDSRYFEDGDDRAIKNVLRHELTHAAQARKLGQPLLYEDVGPSRVMVRGQVWTVPYHAVAPAEKHAMMNPYVEGHERHLLKMGKKLEQVLPKHKVGRLEFEDELRRSKPLSGFEDVWEP
jgi:hypothetical protein